MTPRSCASASRRGEPRVHLEPVGLAEMLQRGRRDRRQPDLRPRQRRGREERQRVLAEDLVADGLVEEIAGRQADRPRLALVEDALGLEEERLAEALRADDDELVVAVEAQEVVDLGRAVQQGLVEVLGDADVVGVHGPRSHMPSCPESGLEDTPLRRSPRLADLLHPPPHQIDVQPQVVVRVRIPQWHPEVAHVLLDLLEPGE